MTDEEDVLQQQKILTVYRRSLIVYLEQVAQAGKAFASPVLLQSIDAARDEIRHIKSNLRKKDVFVEDYLFDEKASHENFSTNHLTQPIPRQIHPIEPSTPISPVSLMPSPMGRDITLTDCLKISYLFFRQQVEKFNIFIRNSMQRSRDENRIIPPSFQNRPYKLQLDMYRDIAKYITDRSDYKPKNAILIQYSGASAINLLYTLAAKGTHITMYVKSSSSAESQFQAKRIEDTIQGLHGFFKIDHDYELRIYEYDVPASIRLVKIDDDIIGIGWYTYEYITKSDGTFPDDTYEVSGHDVPGFLLYKGSPEYEIINDMISNQIKNYDAYIKKSGRGAIMTLPEAG